MNRPPMIINEDRPEEYRRVIVKAANNIKMAGTALILALYYAEQKTGFRPSIKVIMDELGKTECQVKSARTDLVIHHFIRLSSDRVEMNWIAILGMAFSDYAFKKSEYKNIDFWQTTPPEEPIYRTLQRLEAKAELQSRTLKDWLTALTPTEYRRLVSIFPEAKDIEFPKSEINFEPEIPPASDKKRWTTKNVFSDPDPAWVMQEPQYDAAGNIVGYTHFSMDLPF